MNLAPGLRLLALVGIVVAGTACPDPYQPIDVERRDMGGDTPDASRDLRLDTRDATGPDAAADASPDNIVAPPCQEGSACEATGPCTRGKVSCNVDGGQTCQQVPLADDTACKQADASGVCKAGVCTNPQCGKDCPGATLCQLHRWNCTMDQWAPRCDPAGTPLPDKTSCGTAKLCHQGQCITQSCMDGLPCGDECAPGQIVCTAPDKGDCRIIEAQVKPDGTACGSGNTCRGRMCVPCAGRGGDCTVECRRGKIDCTVSTGGQPACALTSSVPNGEQCTPPESGKVCNNGGCMGCPNDGMSCSMGCRIGRIQCGTGCVLTGDAPNGTSCGTNLVCSQGMCAAACPMLGMACAPAPCKVGSYACMNNAQVCLATGDAANGSSCMGGAGTCTGGNCSSNCPRAGQSCDVAGQPCAAGVWSCSSSGMEVCMAAGNKPAGTACPTGTCNASGACTCPTGSGCTPTGDNPCRTGMVASCMGATQVCQESGNRPDRTSCGSGRACSGGTCIQCNTVDYCGENCTRCSTDVDNAESACEAGSCIWRCRAGYYRCGNRCVPAADVQPCAPGSNQVECRDAAGTCGSICAEGHHRCSDGACYSNSDKARCGADCNGCSAWNEECRSNRCCVQGGGPCF